MKKEIFKKKKIKNLRSAISMALVCVLLMSGATYAWFSLSNTSKVTGLSLKVTSEGSLKVAPDNSGTAGSFDDSYSLAMNQQTLLPCTSKDGINFLKPVYSNDTTVSGLKSITTGKEKYYYEKAIWLKMEDGGSGDAQTYAVTFAQKNGEDGTYINDASSGGNAQMSIRVSFAFDGSTVADAVYEPNSDGTFTAAKTVSTTTTLDVDGESKQSSSYGVYSNLHQQLINGKFTDAGTIYRTDDSSEILELTNNVAKKVTIRAWFEGMDAQCADEISLKEITGQFKFIANKKN